MVGGKRGVGENEGVSLVWGGRAASEASLRKDRGECGVGRRRYFS